MRKKLEKIKVSLLVLIGFIMCNPLIARASDGSFFAPNFDEIGPVQGVIALIVLIVVAYKVYHLMYDGTVLIGTREGINKEKIGMLTIPFLCGLFVAGIVLWVLGILIKLLPFILIGVAIIAVIVIICVIVSKIGKSSGDSLESKDADGLSMSASKTENTIQGEGTNETVLEGNNAEIGDDVYKNTDMNYKLRQIMSAVDIRDDYCITGTPISNGKMLENARSNFKIPDSENVYLIFDATVLGSCKTGFAICESGIYSMLKRRKFIPWAEYKVKQNVELVFLALSIDGDEFSVTGKLRKNLYDIFMKIHGSID